MCCSLVHCDVNLWVPPVPMTIWALGHSGAEKCAWTPAAEKWHTGKLMHFSPFFQDLQPSRFIHECLQIAFSVMTDADLNIIVNTTWRWRQWPMLDSLACNFLFPKALTALFMSDTLKLLQFMQWQPPPSSIEACKWSISGRSARSSMYDCVSVASKHFWHGPFYHNATKSVTNEANNNEAGFTSSHCCL